MIIEDIFDKDINRHIKGVIKVGQTKDENIYQELDEYVVTNELNKHFKEFFQMYQKSMVNATDDMGVWISGFFGSGKSHFLKILSYLLDSNLTVHDRKPIDFFRDDNKITDSTILADMDNALSVPTDVILFNIDAKNDETNDMKDSILRVFYKVFNNMQGYSEQIPYIANLEKKLNDVNKYQSFKEAFNEINGNDWIEERDDADFMPEDIAKALSKIDFMSVDDAKNWLKNAESNYSLSIEKFAEEVHDYLKNKGNNHHIVFLVDEMGQYIGGNTKLMLNLQTLTEELGIQCHGQAWIIVTSQEDIDTITKNKGNDFSKIQGRFKTRLSLSSSNVDEVIRKRILEKTQIANDTLKLLYEEDEAILKNLLTFDNKSEMKIFKNEEEFSEIYPFIPYQFQLLQKVLSGIREHGASGKHLAEGERSMLALFQESAQHVREKEIGVLIPFNIFYNAIEKFIDHSQRIVISDARKNTLLNDFDVEVLKTLYLIKYVKEIESNVNNITTLLIDDIINVDRLSLKAKIEKSLDRLKSQTLIQKNGNLYEFLTNEEQDINKEIKNMDITTADILNNELNIIFGDIITESRYQYSKRYNFRYNQCIDDIQKNNKNEIGLRFITSYYDETPINNENSLIDKTSMENLDFNLREKSKTGHEVIFQFLNDDAIRTEIEERLQIHKYLTKCNSNTSESIQKLLLSKSQEAEAKQERIINYIEDAIKTATIYIDGEKDTSIIEKKPTERIEDALKKLIEKVYNKLSYMEFHPVQTDITKCIDNYGQTEFNNTENQNQNALNDLDIYIQRESDIHSKPSIKTIENKFSKAPYGFVDLDIQWLIAKLYSQKNISLILNGETITPNNKGQYEIFTYITENKYNEKILIERKKKIGQKTIRAAKKILKDFYHKTENSTDGDIIKENFQKETHQKNEEINKLLIQYNSKYKYPGKEALNNASDFLLTVQNKTNTDQFYKFIEDNQEEFQDINDELTDVIQFFDGQQSKIFRKSTDLYQVYELNKYLIINEELETLAKEIHTILIMSNPYSNIRKLIEYNSKLEPSLQKIIQEEREQIKPYLQSDKQDLLNQLNTEELKQKYSNKINNIYDELLTNLEDKEDIASIKGIKDQSTVVHDKLQEQIKPTKIYVNPNPEPEPQKSKEIQVKDLIENPKTKIETEEDLNNFINNIKSKIQKQRENNITIYIKR